MGRTPTGSILERRLSDGTLAFYLRVRVDGRREREILHERRSCDCGCGGGWSATTAQTELDNILQRVRAGVWRPRGYQPPQRAEQVQPMPTFHEYASAWLARKVSGAIGDGPIDRNTELDYLWRLQRHLLPFFGREPLDQIDQRKCEAFKAAKLQEARELRDTIAAGAVLRDRRGRRVQPLSLSSIGKLLSTLAQILDDAIEDSHVAHNPARSKRLRIKAPRPRRTFLEMDELVAVIDAAGAADAPATTRPHTAQAGSTAAKVAERLAAGMRPTAIAADLGISKGTVGWHVRRLDIGMPGDYVGRRAIVATLGYAGPRVSELCDMKIGHVRVHDASGARFRIPDAKTQAGVRTVEMSGDLVEEWTLHIDRLRRSGFPTDADAWAFPNRRGGRISRQRVAAIVRDAVKDASTAIARRGLPPLQTVTPHSLRRTYISIALLASSFDLRWVMDQVGHDNSAMTLDVYNQLQQRHRRANAAEFDRLVRDARERLYGTEATDGDQTVEDIVDQWAGDA